MTLDVLRVYHMDKGVKEGTGFSVNAPLTSDRTDEAYEVILNQ